MGVSKRYAEHLKTSLGGDLIEADKLTADKLVKYGTVVFCGGVYGGEWSCLKAVEKCRTVLQSKKTAFIFAVWNDSPENIPSEELKKQYLGKVVISPDVCLAVEGAIDKQKLTFMQKMTVSGIRKKHMSKDSKDDDDFNIIGVIDGFSGGFCEKTAERITEAVKAL